MSDAREPQVMPVVNIGDPIYRLLHNRLGLELRHVMVLLVLNNFVQVVLIPFIHHLRRGSSYFTGLNLQDIQTSLAAFVSQPIILYVYWRSVEVIPAVFKSMHENNAIRQRGELSVPEFLHNLEARMTSRFFSVALVLLILAALALFNLIGWAQHRFQSPLGSYPYTDFQQYALYTTHGFLRFWFVGWAIGRGLIFIEAIRRWWRDFDANVQPYHPDGAGGLSAIGDTTLFSGLMVGAGGLFIASSIIVNVQSGLGTLQLSALIILLTVVALLAPLSFFLPIWSTHQAMLQARGRRVAELARRFSIHWNAVYEGEGLVDDERVERLASLAQLREVTLRAMPVWPYGRGDVRRFGLSLTPIWTIGLYVFIEVVVPDLLSRLLGLG